MDMNNKKVFTCADNFDAMMTCVYEAWLWVATENSKRAAMAVEEHKCLKPKNKACAQTFCNAQEDIRLAVEPIYQTDMFSEYIHIEADNDKAQKVVDTIIKSISKDAYICVYYAAMSQAEGKLEDIYRFIRLGLQYGARVTYMLTEPVVMRIIELRKRVGNEMHHFREFVRFNRIQLNEAGKSETAIYVSHIEPKSNVVYMVAGHFADRMPSEHWMIIDDTRKLAVIHPADKSGDMYQRYMTQEEFDGFKDTEKKCNYYEDLWQTFFEAISIKERENYRCQRNLFPLWMRKHVTEFQNNNSKL